MSESDFYIRQIHIGGPRAEMVIKSKKIELFISIYY